MAIIGTRGYPSYYGGFETAVRRLAPYLADRSWDVRVYGRPGASRTDDPGRDARVETVVTWGIERKSLSTLSYGLTAALHAKRMRPDVALVMNVANGYWLPILRAAGIPTLVNVDGIEWEREKWGRLAKMVFRGGARWTAKYGTRMVYDSREIERRWSSEFGVEGDFIPYGGDAQVVDLPLERGLSHRRYVLVVARFVPENSIAEFFGAVPALAEHTDIVIVGSSGYGDDFDVQAKALASTHRRVTWLGHINDDLRLHSLWQHAGAYFHGHSVGGTNPALVQAMACGAPTVARDTAYNREVLGESAMFVEAHPAQIREGLLRLIADSERAERMSLAIKERAKERYSWESVNASYEASLRELVAQSWKR
ncbi:glycosyltransferase [Humibacter ginsengiterrae]